MNYEKIIYQLTVEDIIIIIDDNGLKMHLSEKDIEFIEKKIGDYIDWRGAIENALSDLQNAEVK